MLLRAAVRAKALELLEDAITVQGARKSSSKDTPIPSGTTPQIIVYTDDTTVGGGGNPPQFQTMVLTTVEIVAEGATAQEAEALLDTLCEQTEIALLGNPDFVRFFEKIESVETKTDYRGQEARKHTFSAVMEIKGSTTEIFEPVITGLLAGLNIYVDSINVFDPNGFYDPPFPYEVADPPRASGPDGRDEVSASVEIEHPAPPEEPEIP